MRIERLFAASALLAIPAFAWAGVGWDWDEDFTSRHWRTESLEWATQIHPEHPSALDLVTFFTPPPHEMWCHSSINPTQEDFDIFHDLKDEWLHDFLDIPIGEPLPNMAQFPRECER